MLQKVQEKGHAPMNMGRNSGKFEKIKCKKSKIDEKNT